jgi:hypothetical protein
MSGLIPDAIAASATLADGSSDRRTDRESGEVEASPRRSMAHRLLASRTLILMDFDETAAWFEQRNLRFMPPEQRGSVWVADYQHRSSCSGEWWFAADSPEAAAEAARDNAEVVL